MTTLTKAGQQIANVLHQARVAFDAKETYWRGGILMTGGINLAALNAAAEILKSGEGAGLREALEKIAANEFVCSACSTPDEGCNRATWLCGRQPLDCPEVARTALASPQPAVEGPIAAGVSAERRAELLAEYGDYDTDCPLGRVYGTAKIGEFVAILRATLAPPADPKTPDAGVERSGEASGCEPGTDGWMQAVFGSPAPVGEDETGVREALKKVTAERDALHVDKARGHRYRDILVERLKTAERALAPQPPKAETPAGVGEATGWPAGYQETFGAISAAVTVHGDGMIGISVKEFYRALAYPDAALSAASAARPGDGVEAPRPLSEYHEDHGFVTWWVFPVREPAWIGGPNCSDWPGYHTHWTPHPPCPEPSAPAADGGRAQQKQVAFDEADRDFDEGLMPGGFN